MEKEDDSTSSFCLSFNSYTNDRIFKTAEQVGLECSNESNDEFEFINLPSNCDLVFPIFDQSLIDKEESSLPLATVKTKLRDLFLQEDPSYSSSSSDEDVEEEHELEGVMYCPWTPEKTLKSKSTGSSSSMSWKISDLLKRSYSEGKQSLKFLNSNSRNRDEFTKKKKEKEMEKVCAHEKFYLRNKAMRNEEKRKSYLPYKQHVVGFFFTVK